MALIDDSSHGNPTFRGMGLLENNMTVRELSALMAGGAKLSRRFAEWIEGVGGRGGNLDGANRDLKRPPRASPRGCTITFHPAWA